MYFFQNIIFLLTVAGRLARGASMAVSDCCSAPHHHQPVRRDDGGGGGRLTSRDDLRAGGRVLTKSLFYNLSSRNHRFAICPHEITFLQFVGTKSPFYNLSSRNILFAICRREITSFYNLQTIFL
jgi:hypothetical protein